MLLSTDLHIHTALSPCGDEDMTPNNIVNMAKLNGLDVIAITDHNSAENVEACMKVGAKVGVVVLPGMELQTREDVHVICLFSCLDKIMEFQQIVYDSLPVLDNNVKLFGEQQVLDDQDQIVGDVSRLLLTASSLSLEEAFAQVERLEGVFIPAHVDKNANSIIANLGFIPDGLAIKNIEYKSMDKVNKYIMAGLIKEGYRLIKSSDAHYLQDIQEEQNKIECEMCNTDAVIKALRA